MASLPRSTYVSLTTFRRSGVPVATPVWAAPLGTGPAARHGPATRAGDGADGGADDTHLVVWTRADSGKVKRLRHTARVTVAPCDVRGRVTGPAVDGVAEFIERDGHPQAIEAMRQAYGRKFTAGAATSRLWHRLLRRPGDRHAFIRIRPA